MTNTFSWHSALATDPPIYHDDTRCLDGAAIKLEDRRPGDGGRDACEHCTRILVESIQAGLLRARR